MDAIEQVKKAIVESTNSFFGKPMIGQSPAYKQRSIPNPVQKHTAYLDLGVMGDDVAATVEWIFDLDQEERQAEILRIKIDMPHKFHGLDVYNDLPERVIDDIKIDIAKEWE